MSIARNQVADYLARQFSSFATEIGQALADDGPLGYGPDIDNALRDLEVVEANLTTETIAETLRRNYFTLAEYYAARRMWVRMSAKANRRLGPASVDYSDVLGALKAIMDDAAGRAAALDVVAAESAWSFARLNLDYIEPEDANA